MKVGADTDVDIMLASKVLINATLKANQAGKMTFEVADAVADPKDDKPLKVRITVEVIDE